MTSVKEITETKNEEKTNYVKMYKVIMHNDPKTTMDFVAAILIKYYEKKPQDAIKLMMEIHEKGCGLAGVYPYEGAEFRVEQTHSLARASGYPLSCSIEPE